MKEFLKFPRYINTIKTALIHSTLALMATLLLAGCVGKGETPVAVPAGAQPGELVGLEPCIYEANKVEYEADCGTLVVPENRADPNSRLIALPVIRVRAIEENPSEPIFYYAGGPGGPNVKFQHLERLIDDHDIVMVGYRGEDGSVVLDCPEVIQAIKDADPDLLSMKSLANIGDAFTRCGARIEANGVDLNGYNIIEKIEDSEAARVALGYERVSLLGESYGTRLEQIYLWMHPESLHRVIMISVNPPGNMVWEPDYFDRLIEQDAELCAQDPECSKRTDDLAETMKYVANNIPDRWMLIPLDPGMVRAMSFVQLFYRGSATQVYDAFLKAEAGDFSGLALMSLVGEIMLPAMNNWGFAVSMGYTADFDPTRDYCNDMNPPESIMGAAVSEFYWCSSQHTVWPADLIPEEYRHVQSSDIETLLVSGNDDFSTPAWTATHELLPALNNAEQVILSEYGHVSDIWTLQPEATRHLLTTFYATGDVDDSLFTYQPMNFDAGLMSFPLLAKVLVVIVIMVPIFLALLIWVTVRRMKRRKGQQI